MELRADSEEDSVFTKLLKNNNKKNTRYFYFPYIYQEVFTKRCVSIYV